MAEVKSLHKKKLPEGSIMEEEYEGKRVQLYLRHNLPNPPGIVPEDQKARPCL
jgi:hypothetical protein